MARLHSACTVAKSTTNLKEIMLANLPKRDDVQWMKHAISRLNAKHVEDAKDVLEYREAHLQSDLRLTTRLSNRGSQWRGVETLIFPHLSMTPQDHLTTALHNPQRAGALVTSIILDGGPHGWVPVNPTVHPGSQSGRSLWVARRAPHLHEPKHEGNGRSIHNTFFLLLFFLHFLLFSYFFNFLFFF